MHLLGRFGLRLMLFVGSGGPAISALAQGSGEERGALLRAFERDGARAELPRAQLPRIER